MKSNSYLSYNITAVMLKVSWTKHTTKEQVLNRMHAERILLNEIKIAQSEYFGHTIGGSKYQSLRLIRMGQVEGKRMIGRKKLSWMPNIRQWRKLFLEEMFRAVDDQERFHPSITMLVTIV